MRSSRLWLTFKESTSQVIEASLIGYLFFLPWEHTAFIRDLLLAVGILTWGVERYILKKDRVFISKHLEKYILFYVAAVLISVFFSEAPIASVRSFRSGLSKFLLIFALVVRVYQEPGSVRRLLYGLIGSSTLVKVYGLVGYLFHWRAAIEPGGLATGPFNHHNPLGQYLALHIVVLLALFLWEQRNLFRLLWGILIPLHLALLLFSQSRGALVGVLIAGGVLFILQRQARVIIAFSLILFTLGWGFNQDRLFNRFRTIAQPETYETGIASRDRIWSETLVWIGESPWIGHGYGGTPFSIMSRSRSRIEFDVPHTHNLFLQVFFESGVLGLSAFVLLFFRIAWETFRLRHRSAIYPLLFSLFVLIFLLGMTEPFFLMGHLGIFLWILFGLVDTMQDHSFVGLGKGITVSPPFKILESDS